MRPVWLIWAGCVLFLSCKGKDRVPGDILPEKKMQAILWDMMRADQFLTDFVLNKDTTINKEKESQRFYQQVYSIHKVTKEEFRKSFEFYRSHPSLLKDLMDSIGHRPVNPPGTNVPDTGKKKFLRPAQVN